MTEGTVGTDLAAVAAAYDRSAIATHTAAAEEERRRVLAEFPLADWDRLPLERYALGIDRSPGAEPSFCRLMEFGTPELGSIKGGSAGKHIMFRHRSGEWRLAAPLQNDEPRAAWQRLRAEFKEAFDSLGEGAFDIDDLELLRYGPALVTKSFATYFPEHFLPVYSLAHLHHFIKLLGGSPNRGAPTWDANRQLRELVLAQPEFADWAGHEVMRFLYEKFDPRPRRRPVWKIAPGRGARLWDDCLAGGFICVGWEEVGDLGQYENEEELRLALNEALPDKPGGNKLVAPQLLAFRDLEPGDLVVANRGKSEVLALGTVTDGYRFEPTRRDHQNLVSVTWDTSYAQKLDRRMPWQATFAKVTAAQLATIRAGRQATAEPGSAAAEEPTELPPDVQRVLDALERKGQVILHGPPGTGKTRLAHGVALAVSGRGTAIDAPPAERRRTVSEVLATPEARMVTFHPSYGYEDFVEGFKPDLAASGPGLTLGLKDGLFHALCTDAAKEPDRPFLLIIDEINRGDLPRIFGELITLIESDKRGVPVRLPISGREFTVPANVRIIGTMNTADRSISHLDAAIRRRFAFVGVGPDPDAVSGSVGPLDLRAFFSELNARITRHLDADHQLGHSYFLSDGAPLATEEELAAALQDEVIPLLEDYCLGRADLMHRILGRLVAEETGEPVRIPAEQLAATLVAEFTEAFAAADV